MGERTPGEEVGVLMDRLILAALGSGANNAGIINVREIPFRREFRAACLQNTCGKFGMCWMCPPDIGDIDELIDKAKLYAHMLVFCTVGLIEDSFDIEGMSRCAAEHNRVAGVIADKLSESCENMTVLGAGACQICEICSKPSGKLCSYPDRAIAPMEAYGIAVSELAALCGMNYINGQNTVTYFGGVLFG